MSQECCTDAELFAANFDQLFIRVAAELKSAVKVISQKTFMGIEEKNLYFRRNFELELSRCTALPAFLYIQSIYNILVANLTDQCEMVLADIVLVKVVNFQDSPLLVSVGKALLRHELHPVAKPMQFVLIRAS